MTQSDRNELYEQADARSVDIGIDKVPHRAAIFGLNVDAGEAFSAVDDWYLSLLYADRHRGPEQALCRMQQELLEAAGSMAKEVESAEASRCGGTAIPLRLGGTGEIKWFELSSPTLPKDGLDLKAIAEWARQSFVAIGLMSLCDLQAGLGYINARNEKSEISEWRELLSNFEGIPERLDLGIEAICRVVPGRHNAALKTIRESVNAITSLFSGLIVRMHENERKPQSEESLAFSGFRVGYSLSRVQLFENVGRAIDGMQTAGSRIKGGKSSAKTSPEERRMIAKARDVLANQHVKSKNWAAKKLSLQLRDGTFPGISRKIKVAPGSIARYAVKR